MTDKDERTINRAIVLCDDQGFREEARAALHRLFRDRRRLEDELKQCEMASDMDRADVARLREDNAVMAEERANYKTYRDELARLREEVRWHKSVVEVLNEDVARLREENEKHRGNHVPDESLRERHSAINADRAKDVYKQGHDERCYICQQAEEIARLRASARAWEADAALREQNAEDCRRRRDTLLAALRGALYRLVDGEDMCPNCTTPWKCNGPHTLVEDDIRAAIAEVEEEK